MPPLITKTRLALEQARQASTEAARIISKPEQRFPRFPSPGTRVGQVIAFLILPVGIMVSLQIIVAANQLFTGVFGVEQLAGGQNDIFAWLITAITGGAFLLFAWTWFQWVRTAGFGFFSWE